MLNAERLLDAMQGVRPEKVEKAARFLGYTEQVQPRRRGHRRLWSSLLVAAVLISLFTATAYALGLFQMSGRRGPEHFTAQIGGQNVQWPGEYIFEFEGPEECPEVHFQVTWAPSADYWHPAELAEGWTNLAEGQPIYNEESGIYTASCVVDVMYASQFVDGGAMILTGFQPQQITQETWGEVQVYKFQAKATHAVDAAQTQFLTGNFVILFHPEQGWIIGVRGYDSMENLEGIARGLKVESTGNTIRRSDFESPYDFCDIYMG